MLQVIVDNYLQNSERYKCFRRVGITPPIQSLKDDNVRTGTSRYDCNLVSSQNTIYRRY